VRRRCVRLSTSTGSTSDWRWVAASRWRRRSSWRRGEGIGAIVDLRVESCDDEAALRLHGLDFLHLPTEDCCAITPRMIDDGVEWVRHAGSRPAPGCSSTASTASGGARCWRLRCSSPVEPDPLDAMNRLQDRPTGRLARGREQLDAFRIWVGALAQATGTRVENPELRCPGLGRLRPRPHRLAEPRARSLQPNPIARRTAKDGPKLGGPGRVDSFLKRYVAPATVRYR
jgi:hypothetical protein